MLEMQEREGGLCVWRWEEGPGSEVRPPLPKQPIDSDRTCSRRLTQLSKDTSILSQVNIDIVESLRRIRLDISLSPAEIRVQIDDILAMVCTNYQINLS